MNITYYLGAGASAYCLPVLDEVSQRLSTLKDYVSRILDDAKLLYGNLPINRGREPEILEDNIIATGSLISDINWIEIELDKHQTVDTLAKKFFLNENRHEDLFKLKTVLIILFLFEQSKLSADWNFPKRKKQIPDKRYDSFIATLIGDKIGKTDMPNNVKIITWNYDLQFELAFQEYLKENINKIQSKLQCVPNTMTIQNLTPIDLNQFAIVRLNGVAGMKWNRDHTDIYSSSYLDDLKNSNTPFNLLINIYSEIKESYAPIQLPVKGDGRPFKILNLFNYNWEYQKEFDAELYPGYKSRLEYASNIMRETDIVVVIGYSFPIFNRELDSELMSLLKNKCRKIYVQDCKPAPIVNKLLGINPNFVSEDEFKRTGGTGIPVVPIDYTDQFHLPDEFQLRKKTLGDL